MEFQFFFKSITDAKFEPGKLTFLRLMPSAAAKWGYDKVKDNSG